jgi:putative flippase GtrA
VVIDIKSIALKFKNILKFLCSSFFAFLIDYCIFSLIIHFLTGMITPVTLTLANVSARIISSSVNFTINQKLVFKCTKHIEKSAMQFFSLAATILLFNNLLLNFLTHSLSINHYIAKILTEMFFFTFNFIIQNFIIFKK